jgi:hypothetical protein
MCLCFDFSQLHSNSGFLLDDVITKNDGTHGDIKFIGCRRTLAGNGQRFDPDRYGLAGG